jgi:hypothetical protein
MCLLCIKKAYVFLNKKDKVGRYSIHMLFSINNNKKNCNYVLAIFFLKGKRKYFINNTQRVTKVQITRTQHNTGAPLQLLRSQIIPTATTNKPNQQKYASTLRYEPLLALWSLLGINSTQPDPRRR